MKFLNFFHVYFTGGELDKEYVRRACEERALPENSIEDRLARRNVKESFPTPFEYGTQLVRHDKKARSRRTLPRARMSKLFSFHLQ